jgi:hypothetical protein
MNSKLGAQNAHKSVSTGEKKAHTRGKGCARVKGGHAQVRRGCAQQRGGHE